MRKFAGWEGRFTPAQVSQPINDELIVMDESLRTLSGGKPPFPTCEFLSLEWYLRSFSVL